ncbi:MAG: AmmeMemoRadiSam system protein B [Minisyncoccia bacterium]
MKEKIRYPIVAGKFYPEDKNNLETMIEEFLDDVEDFKIDKNIFGLLVPHAGYIFSGQVAAYGYKLIKDRDFESIILIGDSHYEYFDGVSIWDKGKWITPLGEVIIDEDLGKELLNFSKRFIVKDSAHIFEHSLEVQLPFLQKALKNFKILPIIFGSEDKDWKILANAILTIMKDRKILIVISSDLSHYPPYEIAKKVDSETIDAILNCDPEEFIKKIEELKKSYPDVDTFACAQDSIKTILEISKNLKARAKLLKYQNSGDTKYGDKFQVVGYSSIVFFLK